MKRSVEKPGGGKGEDEQVAVHEVDEVDEQSVEAYAEEDEVLDAIRFILAAADLRNGERDEELLKLLHGLVDLVDKRPEVFEEREG